MKRLTTVLVLAMLVAAGWLRAADTVAMTRRAAELKSLKWGMFVCWSLSTFSGKEWTPGVKDIAEFKATACDTDQWARAAKDAGMGYILFLTKHHDGFCLWDTKTTARKVTNAPLHRDVLAQLRKSCDKYGIKLALYFSEGEFSDNKNYHPGGYTPAMKKAQLQELLTQYGPIEYIWFDHAQTDGGLSHAKTTAWCKQFQPACFIGYNHGEASGDIRLGEMGHPAPLADVAGAGFNSKFMKGYNGYLLAEFTYPILPEHQGGAMWFYSLPTHDNLCRAAAAIYKDYCGAVKYGNIFSLDVGPDYQGRLRTIDVETLHQVGELIRHAPPPGPPSLTLGKQATASSTWPGAGYEADKAIDGDEQTRWGAAPSARNAWLQVDLGKETLVGQAVVKELAYRRVERFTIECRDGDTWRVVASGTTIAGTKVLDFSPVTARYVRLNTLQAREVPTIEEFELYGPARKAAAG